MTGMGRAGFFTICGEAATTTLGAKGPVKLKNPLNLLNLHTEGVSKGKKQK